MYYNKKIKTNIGTFIALDLEKALSLVRAIMALNHDDNLGQRSVLLSMEDNSYRIDTMWTSDDDDDIVYCSETDLYEMMEDETRETRTDS